MKQLRTFSLMLFVLLLSDCLAKANTYYFSSSSGDDSRTTTEAQNPNTPWKSISKLNSIISLLAPGDSILFKRGDTFYGSIYISVSGLLSLPIVFSAYGNGSQPIISGLTTLNGWSDAGGGVQEANCSSCTASDNILIINGVLQRIGRYPNTGYLTYQSYSGNNSITSNQLSGATNWTGAEVVIRKNHWVMDRNKITGQSGNTINYNSASTYGGTKNFGFFIQNDPRTLDTMGEWCFNSGNSDLSVYFGGNVPSQYNVQTSTVDTLIFMEGQSNIIFDNLTFEGSNQYDLLINWSNYITIQNCSFDYSGSEAIRCSACKYFTLTNSSLNHTLDNAIDLGYNSTNSTITNNIIKNTGYMAGMGGDGDGTYSAMVPGAGGSVIKNNEIDSTGYNAIIFDGNASVVEDNFINTFCFVKDDGGGIYTYTGNPSLTYQERTVKNNIVINGIGAPVGANGTLEVHGIYMDDNASQVTISGNTVANCNSAALVVHNAHDLIFDSNTVYNSAKQFDLSEDNNSNVIRNIISSHNIFFSKSPLQPCMDMSTVVSSAGNLGTFDSNYYCMPIDTSQVITAYIGNNNYAFSLSDWKSYSSQDAHSKGFPVFITDTSKILFQYNATSSDMKILLNGTYIGMDGTHYSNSITLKPFSSIILIKISNSNSPPVANAGTNQTITLPLDSVTLNGSASYDPDGTITGWKWTKLSGPPGFVINDSSASKTIVSGLTAATYVFTLTVTDNQGANDSANVTIIVNKQNDTTVTPPPPPNQPPVAKASSNQTITLPLDSVILDGSASYDPDGTIADWKWTKQSGPSGFVINDSSTSKTIVSGLTAGTYIFTLTVTDNQGASSSANDTIRVNRPPVANAGNDTNLFLPDDSALLNGTASYDPDGKIVSWSWSQISGPSAINILNVDSAQAKVNQLANGVYVFALIVTDNDGAKDTAEVTIGVYQKPNRSPVANAGQDITIVWPQNTVTLDGTSSDDPDGTIVKYHWNPMTAPANTTMLTPDSSTCIVSGLQMGTYDFQLTVTDNNGLSSTATVSVYVLPGQDTTTTTFHIYPNPAHNELNVQLDKAVTGLLAFRIIDVNGRILKVYQFGQLPMHVTKVLDISNLAPGMYFVQLTEDNQLGNVAKMIKY